MTVVDFDEYSSETLTTITEESIQQISSAERRDRQIVNLLFWAERELSGAMYPTLVPYGLTRAQAGALQQLRGSGSLSMRELAANLYCDASNVTRIVDRLAERGLLERQVPTDRRVKRVVLTGDGVRVADEMWRLATQSSFIMNLPDTAKDDLCRTLGNAFKESPFAPVIAHVDGGEES